MIIKEILDLSRFKICVHDLSIVSVCAFVTWSGTFCDYFSHVRYHFEP